MKTTHTIKTMLRTVGATMLAAVTALIPSYTSAQTAGGGVIEVAEEPAPEPVPDDVLGEGAVVSPDPPATHWYDSLKGLRSDVPREQVVESQLYPQRELKLRPFTYRSVSSLTRFTSESTVRIVTPDGQLEQRLQQNASVRLTGGNFDGFGLSGSLLFHFGNWVPGLDFTWDTYHISDADVTLQNATRITSPDGSKQRFGNRVDGNGSVNINNYSTRLDVYTTTFAGNGRATGGLEYGLRDVRVNAPGTLGAANLFNQQYGFNGELSYLFEVPRTDILVKANAFVGATTFEEEGEGYKRGYATSPRADLQLGVEATVLNQQLRLETHLGREYLPGSEGDRRLDQSTFKWGVGGCYVGWAPSGVVNPQFCLKYNQRQEITKISIPGENTRSNANDRYGNLGLSLELNAL